MKLYRQDFNYDGWQKILELFNLTPFKESDWDYIECIELSKNQLICFNASYNNGDNYNLTIDL